MDEAGGSEGRRAALATRVKCIAEAAAQKKIKVRAVGASAKDCGDLRKELRSECLAELDCLRNLELHLTRALLFERSLDDVEESFCCPICLDDLPVKDCGIAPCAHKACT